MDKPNQITLDFSGPLLTDEEHRVWQSVSERAGRDQAILGPRLAELAGVDYYTVRQVISHLVNDHGKLIASCTHGYYVPETSEEILAATKALRHRGIMILLRASRLQKTSIEEVFGQARMEFEQPAHSGG